MPVIYIFNYIKIYQSTYSIIIFLSMMPFALLISFFFALVFYLIIEAPFGIFFSKLLKQIN